MPSSAAMVAVYIMAALSSCLVIQAERWWLGFLVVLRSRGRLRYICGMVVESFNLPPPPGFCGLREDLPIRIYQRNLPHWRQDGATYFVTFQLADAVPQEKLKALKQWRGVWEKENSEPRSEATWDAFAREVFRRNEAWMDEGYGECVFARPTCAELMANALLYFQGKRCITSCYVVMPNHVHAVMKALPTFELEDVLGAIKGYVSHEINRQLKRKGRLWQNESYDRIIRDEEHLYRVVQYIGRNPKKANIAVKSWYRWLRPDWESQGWRFEP